MSAVLRPTVELQIPVKLLPILQPRRYKVMHGGRGGGKSHTVAQVLLMFAMQRRLRILCIREVQKSIQTSSKKVLEDYIGRLGLSAYFDVQRTTIICRTTGSTFEFSGLQDHTADSIRSFEGADIVWVEEAHSVTANSWNILIPTIVRKEGAEIWATFNPDQEDDYVYKRWVLGSDPHAWVCAINWRDNPWLSEAMNDERKALKAANDDLYMHVWEGKPRSAAGILFKRHWFKRFDMGQQPETLSLYMASDYAGAPDPDEPDREPDWTEHGVWGLDHTGDLWAVDWWSGQEDPSVWIAAWLSMVRRHRPRYAFEEKGVILRTVDGAIRETMRRNNVYVTREALASAGGKADRALGFAARASAGTVWIPRTEWGDRLLNQLCAFTGRDGRVDDMVDVCSLLGRGLDLLRDPPKPKPPEPPEPQGPFTVNQLRRAERIKALQAQNRRTR
jgi:phage terminase large subunit-like protein